MPNSQVDTFLKDIYKAKSQKVFGKKYFGCYDIFKSKILVNLPVFYKTKLCDTEDQVIDMMCSTIEHETLHHVLATNGIIDYDAHHRIIKRITKDHIRKHYYIDFQK